MNAPRGSRCLSEDKISPRSTREFTGIFPVSLTASPERCEKRLAMALPEKNLESGRRSTFFGFFLKTREELVWVVFHHDRMNEAWSRVNLFLLLHPELFAFFPDLTIPALWLRVIR